jgi:carbonic anhydrase
VYAQQVNALEGQSDALSLGQVLPLPTPNLEKQATILNAAPSGGRRGGIVNVRRNVTAQVQKLTRFPSRVTALSVTRDGAVSGMRDAALVHADCGACTHALRNMYLP